MLWEELSIEFVKTCGECMGGPGSGTSRLEFTWSMKGALSFKEK